MLAKVQSILNQNNLSLLETLQSPKLPRRRYWVGLVKDSRGGECLLKVLVSPEEGVIKKFKTEVKFLKDCDLPFLPRIHQVEEDWYLREYVAGDFGGSIVDDFGFKESFFDEDLLRTLATNFRKLQSLEIPGLERHGYKWFKRDFDYYKTHLTTVSKERLDRIKNFLRARKDLLDSAAYVLTHGDLYPANFVKTSTGVKILDWELLHLNNPAFDVCFVWMLLWQEPELQKVWRGEFGGGDLFEKPFSICQVSLSLRFIRHSEIMLDHFIRPWEVKRKKTAKASMEAHRKVLEQCLNPKGLGRL